MIQSKRRSVADYIEEVSEGADAREIASALLIEAEMALFLSNMKGKLKSAIDKVLRGTSEYVRTKLDLFLSASIEKTLPHDILAREGSELAVASYDYMRDMVSLSKRGTDTELITMLLQDNLKKVEPVAAVKKLEKLYKIYPVWYTNTTDDNALDIDSPIVFYSINTVIVPKHFLRDAFAQMHELGHLVGLSYNIRDKELQTLWKVVFRQLLRQNPNIQDKFDTLANEVQAGRLTDDYKRIHKAIFTKSPMLRLGRVSTMVRATGTLGGMEMFSQLFAAYHLDLLDETQPVDKELAHLFRRLMKKHGIKV